MSICLLTLLAACESGEEKDLSRMGTPIVTRGVAVTTGPSLQADLVTPSATVPSITPEPSSGMILASGELDLLAADTADDPGFQAAFSFAHTLPGDLETGAGGRLVLALRDESRPQQTCAEDHPRSGCATVDWSDEDMVFDNSLTLKLESGARVYFLSASGQLADEADAVNADCAHTAVGGSEQIWQVDLSEPVEPGSDLELNLVMTKFGAPDVRIKYEIRVTSSEDATPMPGGGC